MVKKPISGQRTNEVTVQDGGELQRKLAQLELDVDREQGWIRGGTKTDVPPPL